MSAFHFHNFFDDVQTLRNKYLTYGHAELDEVNVPLSSMANDVDIVVHCVHGMPNNSSSSMLSWFRGGFKDVLGPKPIFFQSNETYQFLRHAAVHRMVLGDEKLHGATSPLKEESKEISIMHW